MTLFDNPRDGLKPYPSDQPFESRDESELSKQPSGHNVKHCGNAESTVPGDALIGSEGTPSVVRPFYPCRDRHRRVVAPPTETVVVVVLLLIGAGAFGVAPIALSVGTAHRACRDLYRGLWLLRVETTSTTTASTGKGWIELVGRIVAEEPLRSPFERVDCVAYEYEVTKRPSESDPTSSDVTVRGRRWTSFYLEDDAGRALVDPTEPELTLRPGYDATFEWGAEPDHVKAFVDDVVFDLGAFEGVIRELSPGDEFRYVERRLDVGETVHVYGPRRPIADDGTTLADPVIVSPTALSARPQFVRAIGGLAVSLPFLALGITVCFAATYWLLGLVLV